MAALSSKKLYHLARSKIGFDGNRRPVYETWQFVTSFVDKELVFMIDNGWKYVHESACHPRRLKDVKYVPFLQGRYYKRPTQHISIKDWQDGIVKCVREKLTSVKYKWYGNEAIMTCHPQKNNRYIIKINAGLYIYRFKIRVDTVSTSSSP
jgi:hypothetical protein